MKKVEWIKTEDIKKKLVKLLRDIYPPKEYRIYGKPEVEGYEMPSFFVDVRLSDRGDETINVVRKQYRVYIVYFPKTLDVSTIEEDTYKKIDEIADMLCCKDARNRKHNMKIEINGRYIDVKEFASGYTGKENNILTIEFSLEFLDFREPKNPEPIMEEFYFKEESEEI